MNEFVENFKINVEELLREMQEELELLIDEALFNMSFIGIDVEDQYKELEKVMFEVLQERVFGLFLEEESN